MEKRDHSIENRVGGLVVGLGVVVRVVSHRKKKWTFQAEGNVVENVFCGGRELAVLHVFRDGQKEVNVARRILLALCLNTN